MYVIRAGIHKMLVRIANREEPDQTASSEAVWSGSVLSFLLVILVRSNFDHYPRECEFGILRKKTTKKKQTRKIFRLCFWLNDDAHNSSVVWELTSEGERLFYCGIVRRKKRVLQGITVCLVSTILGTVWWPGQFQTVSRGQVLVFFYRHSTRMYLMKEKLGGPVPMGLKICPVCLCLFGRQLGFKILDLYHMYT